MKNTIIVLFFLASLTACKKESYQVRYACDGGYKTKWHTKGEDIFPDMSNGVIEVFASSEHTYWTESVYKIKPGEICKTERRDLTNNQE